MTPEQWGIAIAVIVALGGGAGISKILAWARTPAPTPKRQGSVAPPPGYVTHAELAGLEVKLNARIQESEDECEQRATDIDRRSDDRYRELSAEVREVGRGMERALGILEGQRDERIQGARSRR